MKKKYTKPLLFAESFELTEHIATGCVMETNPNATPGTKPLHGKGECAYQFDYGDINMFQYGITTGCGKPEYASDWTTDDINLQCYTAFADLTSLFSS